MLKRIQGPVLFFIVLNLFCSAVILDLFSLEIFISNATHCYFTFRIQLEEPLYLVHYIWMLYEVELKVRW